MANADRMNDSLMSLPDRLQRKATVFVSEAEFFSQLIVEDLSLLDAGSRLLEVGSGMGLLSLFVASQGFVVDSFEPASAGFTEVLRLRRLALDLWPEMNGKVRWHDNTVPACDHGDASYAFAVNVLEHVPNWQSMVSNTMSQLAENACFRVIFPNYMFPYEPHFHMPTLLSKRLTEKFMKRKIMASNIEDPWRFWQDLSWPTGTKIRDFAKSESLAAQFSHRAMFHYLTRPSTDNEFRKRKGGLVTGLSESRVVAGLLKMTPAFLLPIIDCTFSKQMAP